MCLHTSPSSCSQMIQIVAVKWVHSELHERSGNVISVLVSFSRSSLRPCKENGAHCILAFLHSKNIKLCAG